MTDAVQLREVEPADIPILFEHHQDPRALRMAAFTSDELTNRKTFDARWRRILADESTVTRTILFEGRVVGSIASFYLDDLPQVTYWIDSAFWGRGIATQALRQFLNIVKTRPIYASAASDNTGSIRVLEKCGFTIRGYERAFAFGRGEEIEEAMLKLT